MDPKNTTQNAKHKVRLEDEDEDEDKDLRQQLQPQL